MNTDQTFITNEQGQSLLDRFRVLINDTRLFDVLVGFFYTSGFHALYRSLEGTEKVRILVGIGTDRKTHDLVAAARAQPELEFSSAEAKDWFEVEVAAEMEPPGDDDRVEEGVAKFVEWLRSGKLEIKAYPSRNIHAKLYIMTFAEGDRDVGRVITGSSNFTHAGLVDNLEFNVELKNPADYVFALEKFNELWASAVDLKDAYLDTIQQRTWLSDTVSPYELYLKLLYEYFRDQLAVTADIASTYVPPDFMQLEYQEQAVLNAKRILEEYGGVFVADVVGLGKTYVSAMLARQLEGRVLVIAPPHLLDKDNPGSWPSVFSDFRVHADFESLGKLDSVIERGTDRYRNVIIDEAHRFRSDETQSYGQLAQICRGKRVVLVTATPYNNRPLDILNLIKLFQPGRRSTIPNMPNLDGFFLGLERRLRGVDRQTDWGKYIHITKENSREIREKVLRYLTVRRTRSEIERYFSDDLQVRGLKFPEVEDPKPIYYQLNSAEERAFNATINLAVQGFKYARYTPMLYYTGEVTQPEKLAEHNLMRFMKVLLVKRLESSFHAFRSTLRRFISSYERFIREFDAGNVYVSKKHANKIFELLEAYDLDEVDRLIDEGKADRYPAKDFRPEFRKDLAADLEALQEIARLWGGVTRDPKWLAFKQQLAGDPVLADSKLIVFSESKETVDYLSGQLKKLYPHRVLAFSSTASAETKSLVVADFDARARRPKDDYRILVSTEVLSEGVNLHRANVVINYDIPWNPTRMMQRVGRVNRVDTKFDRIHTFTFFPTEQANDIIKLREAAEAKIQAFITMLGIDAKLLTDGEEVESHEMFNRLFSKQTITGEDPEAKSELKYLKEIERIRDSDSDLFAHIKRLPKKARTGRKTRDVGSNLLTYLRKGKLQKFYQCSPDAGPEELDFLTAAALLETEPATPREKPGPDFHALLKRNRDAFEQATTEELQEARQTGGRDSATKVLHILKSSEVRHYAAFTEEDDAFLKRVVEVLEQGDIPRSVAKKLLRALDDELQRGISPPRILAQVKQHVAPELLAEHAAPTAASTAGPREVILSEYFTGK